MPNVAKATQCIRLMISLFIITALVDWTYVTYIQYRLHFATNPWFFLYPFVTMLFCTFCILSVIGLWSRGTWGLSLSYISIMFGSICLSISFALTYQMFSLSELNLVLILALNLLVIFVLMYKSSSANLNND